MNYPKVHTTVIVEMDNGQDKITFSGSAEEVNDRIEKVWKYLPFERDQVRIVKHQIEIIYT